MIYKALAILSGLMGLYAYWPYARDILKGRVNPARSARIMFVLLLFLALFQQHNLGGRGSLGVTIGELIGSIIILFLSLANGVGGLRKLDIVCYILLIIDLFVWLISKNTLVALHLTVLADLIAFTPTLEKTFKNPKSETAAFFVLGAIAPLPSIAAAGKFTYGIILYPACLTIANSFEVFLIKRKNWF